MRNKYSVIILLTIAISSTAYAEKWYEGGNLNDKDNIAWQEADEANRLATAASSIAGLYTGKALKPEMSASITSMDAMKPYAIELMKCINTATEEGFDGISVKYQDLALGCVALMKWLKS